MGMVYGFMDCSDAMARCLRSRHSGMGCIEFEMTGDVATAIRGADGFIMNTVRHPIHCDAFARLCSDYTSDLILMAPIDLSCPDRDHIRTMLAHTRRLSLGNNHPGSEFTAGVVEAAAYLELADEMGFEWVCPWTPYSLLTHMGSDDFALRDLLATSKTMCISFTAYVIAGWLYGNPGIPHQDLTSLAGVDLRARFGLTESRLRGFVAPLSILSGAGGQAGIDNGVIGLMDGLGFDGIMAVVPFLLPPTKKGNQGEGIL